MERVLGNVRRGQVELSAGLVHSERGGPLDRRQADDRLLVVLAAGVDQRQLLGVLACAAPGRAANFVLAPLRLGRIRFRSFAQLLDRLGRIWLEWHDSGFGMELLQVARTRLELGPPACHFQDRFWHIACRSGRLPVAASANVDDAHAGEEPVGEHPLRKRLIEILRRGRAKQRQMGLVDVNRLLLAGFHANRIDVTGRRVERQQNVGDRFAAVLLVEVDLPQHAVHLVVLKQHGTGADQRVLDPFAAGEFVTQALARPTSKRTWELTLRGNSLPVPLLASASR